MKTKGWCNRPTAGRKPRCPSAERAGPPTLCSSAKSRARYCAGTLLKHLQRADHLFFSPKHRQKEREAPAPFVITPHTRPEALYPLSLCRRIKTPLRGLYGLTAACVKQRIKRDAFQALRFALTATG